MPGAVALDNDITLLKAGVATGNNKSAAATWSSIAGLASFTFSGADLAAFAATDFNSPNFGVQMSGISNSGAPTLAVDYVQITITYSAGGVVHNLTMTGAGG